MTKPARTSPLRVIVTADDFGLSPKVDAGILEAVHRGVVRSTALLVNFPDADEAIARLLGAPGLEVGIHLNLTAGPPVLPPRQIPSLVRADGNFHDFTTFFALVALRLVDWGEVLREWEAQIERGLGLGCQFTFLTSHQHVHMMREPALVFAKLGHAYGISAARLSAFRLGDMLRPLRLKALALTSFVPAVRRVFKEQELFYNDSIFEIPPGKPDAALLQLCAIVKTLGGGVYELVCHPGYVDSLLRERDPYVAGRTTELAVLTDARLSTYLESIGAELTTFQALVDFHEAEKRSTGLRSL